MSKRSADAAQPDQQATEGAPGAAGAEPSAENLEFVMDVPVQVTVEIGRRRIKIAELLRMGVGSTIELDKTAGEPLDIYVNDRRIARGEPVVIGDRYGVRLTEVLVGEAGQPKPGGAQ